MENIGGIFVVLICGLIVAIFMAMLEFLWTLRHSEATEVNLQRGLTYSVGRKSKVHRLMHRQSDFLQVHAGLRMEQPGEAPGRGAGLRAPSMQPQKGIQLPVSVF